MSCFHQIHRNHQHNSLMLMTSVSHLQITEGSRTSYSGLWNCFPRLVSYCSDIFSAYTFPPVKHCLDIVRDFHRCIATKPDFKTMYRRDMRHIVHTSHARRVVSTCQKLIEGLEKVGDESQVRLKKRQLNQRGMTIQLPTGSRFIIQLLVDWAAITDLYSQFTFEQLHNHFLGVFKLLKHCMFQ